MKNATVHKYPNPLVNQLFLIGIALVKRLSSTTTIACIMKNWTAPGSHSAIPLAQSIHQKSNPD